MVLLLPFALLAAAPGRVQAGSVRVRSSSTYLKQLIAAGIEHSPTFRDIVERLEASDLIVEVECGRFTGSTLAGRTALIAALPGVRYVLVEVGCPLVSVPGLATIGHELRHALEIASARWVVDDETLALFYTEIGFQNRCRQDGVVRSIRNNGRARCGRACPSRAVSPAGSLPGLTPG